MFSPSVFDRSDTADLFTPESVTAANAPPPPAAANAAAETPDAASTRRISFGDGGVRSYRGGKWEERKAGDGKAGGSPSSVVDGALDRPADVSELCGENRKPKESRADDEGWCVMGCLGR